MLFEGWGPFYVYGNNISNNMGSGISFGENCNNAKITNNVIANNGIGFNLTTVYPNENAVGNEVYNNSIISNQEQVEASWPSDTVSWDNGTIGNYWNDYQSKYRNATEIDASGIGNTPYIIDQNNIDHYPLMHQANIYSLEILFQIAAIAVVIIVVSITALLLYARHRKPSK